MKWDILTECEECGWRDRIERSSSCKPGEPVSVGDRKYQCPGCKDGVRFILSMAVACSPVGCLAIQDEKSEDRKVESQDGGLK